MPRKHSNYKNTKAYNGTATKKANLKIFLPLHLHTHTELEDLHEQFTEQGDTVSLKLIEPELMLRRHETKMVALQRFDSPQVKQADWIQEWGK